MKVLTDARRTAILEAASTLFQEFGYEGASMNELALRLRGSKATLYRYFPSKELLFAAVVRTSTTSHLAQAGEGLQADLAAGMAFRSALLRFAEGVLSVLTNDAAALAVYRMVIAEAGRSEVGELFYESGPREGLAALATLFAAAMARGELRPSDPDVTAQQFLALVTAETAPRLYQRAPAPLTLAHVKGMAARGVDMFLAGAAPR